MILKNAFFIFMKLPKAPSPVVVVSSAKIQKQINLLMPGLRYSEILDSTYRSVSVDEFKKIASFVVQQQKWKEDKYDCDNYSFVLKGDIDRFGYGIPIGIMNVNLYGSGKHAINIFFDSKGVFYAVEPQTLEIWTLKEYMISKGKPYAVII